MWVGELIVIEYYNICYYISIMTESVAFLVSDASRLFRRAFDARARELGVTGQQWRVLALLTRQPGINQGTAAELLEVEPISLSRMVDRLQASGLVERRADPGDRRAWLLHLTRDAVPLVEQMRTMAQQIVETALDGFSQTERNAFEGFASRYHANLSRHTQSRAAAAAKDDDDDRLRENRHARAR